MTKMFKAKCWFNAEIRENLFWEAMSGLDRTGLGKIPILTHTVLVWASGSCSLKQAPELFPGRSRGSIFESPSLSSLKLQYRHMKGSTGFLCLLNMCVFSAAVLSCNLTTERTKKGGYHSAADGALNVFYLLQGVCSSQVEWNSQGHPILDTRISVRPSVLRPSDFVSLRVPPLQSETGWTGELWLKTNLLNWQN